MSEATIKFWNKLTKSLVLVQVALLHKLNPDHGETLCDMSRKNHYSIQIRHEEVSNMGLITHQYERRDGQISDKSVKNESVVFSYSGEAFDPVVTQIK